MSNSFNISVKPEIAAVKADTADIRTDVTAIHDTNLPAVKTDTADIRTDVTAIHDTDLPAVKTDTADIRTDVTAIHDTDLPAAKAVIDSNSSDIGHIRNTAIPNVITAIGANETKIDANLTAIGLIPTAQSFTVIPSDTILASADTERENSTETYVKYKELILPIAGTYRISFDIKSYDASTFVQAAIYKNGVAYGTVHSRQTGSWETFTQDLTFSALDLLQLYMKTNVAGNPASTRNFKLKGTISSGLSVVRLD